MADTLNLWTVVETAITDDERGRLAECEAVIERGLKTFVDVGNALLQIRDDRLYRAEYGTFEDYCRDKWGWQRHYANRLIGAAQVTKNLVPIGTNQTMFVNNPATWPAGFKLPETESQARPLTTLDAEQQREAWQRAVETAPEGKITAAHVQSVVDEIQQKPHVSYNSGNNEWYTPAEYIEAARAVLGEIELDPASSEIANRTVKARVYFTAEDDGLRYSWDGRVWMNPPYAGELIGRFAEKLAYHFETGEVTEAIVLVNNSTETNWFTRLMKSASAVVFPRGRVKFIDAEGNPGAPLQGQAIIYLGNQPDKFLLEFVRFGWGAEVCKQ